MENIAGFSGTPGNGGGSGSEVPRALVASIKHTKIMVIIILALTALGALSATFSPAQNAAPSQPALMGGFLFMIALQYFWLRFVQRGMRNNGHAVSEFIGLQGTDARTLLADVACAALACTLIYAFSGLCTMFLQGAQPELSGMLPKGALAFGLWVCMATAAGVCEEIVFRGYLQRQLTAITGKPVLAILGQAALFGIAHSYQGFTATAVITVAGLIFGSLAAWRGNIRACILAHISVDILAGVLGY